MAEGIYLSLKSCSVSGSVPGYSFCLTSCIIFASNSVCTGPGSIRDSLWRDEPHGAREMDYFSNPRDVFPSGSGKTVVACDIGSAHVMLNLKSCTAKLSQKPSMANLEAAYTSLNTTPTRKCAPFSFRRVRLFLSHTGSSVCRLLHPSG